MEKIELSDIDLSSMKKSKIQGTKSTIYENGDECIKILDGLYPEEKELLYEKLIDMDDITIDGVLMPEKLIMDYGDLCGYTMKNFKDSINLNDYFLKKRYINSQDLFGAIKKASIILRNIHDKKIVCQDLSFDNILINNEGNIMFCDIDGCKYGYHKSPFVSVLLARLMLDYRNENIVLSKNTDRISMMISMLYLMYLKEVQELSKRQYNSLSKHIKTLKNIRKYTDRLINRKKEISEIPYLDELIDDSGDYVIDRMKQLNLK